MTTFSLRIEVSSGCSQRARMELQQIESVWFHWSDFDTGNPEYTILDERVCRRMESEMPLRRVGYHLGRCYFYFPRMMKVGITGGRRNRCLNKIVEGVDNWDNVELNPYKLANPNREGFIGRDLMLKLIFRITLDPALRRSMWKLL